MKKIWLYILLCIPVWALSNTEDSVIEGRMMSQLVIATKRWEHPLFQRADSLHRVRAFHLSLGEFLERSGTANVMSYGAPGALITARFNGTSSDHGLILWNRMPLANPALGLTDMSLLPMECFTQVEMKNGAADGTGGISGMGGTVALHSEENAARMLSVRYGWSSLLNQTLQTKFSWNGKQWYTQTGIYLNDFRNEFSYPDVYQLRHPEVRQQNNNSRQWTLMQQGGWSSADARHSIKGNIWYQYRKNNLPAVMGSDKVGLAQQNDSMLRGYVEYTLQTFSGSGFFDSSPLVVYSSISNEYQRYMDRISPLSQEYSIDSRLDSRVWMSGVSWNPRTRTGTHSLLLDTRYYRLKVGNTSYAGQWQNEPVAALNAAYNARLLKWRSSVSAFVYQEWRAGYTTEPSFGLSWQLAALRKWLPTLQLSYTRRFRVPDFNERFWVPGGNPDLLPEDGTLTAATASWDLVRSGKWEWSLDAMGGNQEISQWIQWVPRTVWEPVNYKEVRIRYAQAKSRISFAWKKNSVHWKGLVHINETWAQNGREGERFFMVYTPRYSWSSGVDYMRSHFDAGVHFRWTDSRFTDERNSIRLQMDPYFLMDISLGYRWKHHSFRIYADNVTDVRYQVVRSYAVPGRVFGFSYQLILPFIHTSS